MSPEPRKRRGFLAGLLTITLLSVIAVIGGYLVMDWQHRAALDTCLAGVDAALPIYPGAEVVTREQYTLSQPFGRVETWVNLSAPASEAEVRAWYTEVAGVRTAEMIAGTAIDTRPWRGDWQVEAAEDGSSAVYLVIGCP